MKLNIGCNKKWISIVLSIVIVAIVLMLWSTRETVDAFPIEEYTEYTNLTTNSDGSNSFELVIESKNGKHDSLLIRTQQQVLTVRVEDTIIYEYQLDEDQIAGKMPPSKWHIIEIPYEYYGETITVEYGTAYERYEDVIPTVYYGNAAVLIAHVTLQTMPAFIISILAIIMGVLSIFVCTVYRKKEAAHINYLGMFLVMFGVWSWGESGSYLFHFADLYYESRITLLMVVLMPVPLMLYKKHSAKEALLKWIDRYIYLCSITACLVVMLGLLGVADGIEMLPISQALLVIGVVLLLWTEMGKVSREKKKKNWLGIASIGVLCGSVLLEVVNLIVGDVFSTGNYASIGVLLFVGGVYTMEISDIKEQKEQSAELQKELQRVNMHLMTDKMKPHFIHNSLLAIQELCFSEPKEAYKAIGMFSKYLRANLEGIGDDELIPFRKELEYLELYMAIQQICFEDDIEFKLEIQESNFYIPPFSIQPIVENAVVHGVRKCRRKGIVEIRTWLEGDDIVIQVQDNGAGFDVDAENQRKFSSSQAVVYRIEHVLEGTLQIESQIGIGTTVTVRAPRRMNEGEVYD